MAVGVFVVTLRRQLPCLRLPAEVMEGGLTVARSYAGFSHEDIIPKTANLRKAELFSLDKTPETISAPRASWRELPAHPVLVLSPAGALGPLGGGSRRARQIPRLEDPSLRFWKHSYR